MARHCYNMDFTHKHLRIGGGKHTQRVQCVHIPRSPSLFLFSFSSSVVLNALIKANETQLLAGLITWNVDG